MTRSGSSRRAGRARLILVLGGASSGKSAASLSLAVKGISEEKPRAYVATGQPLDAEMARKIKRHQASRDASWVIAEVPVDLVAWFHKHGSSYRSIVLDCVTLWLSNLLTQGVHDERALNLARELLGTMKTTGARIVLVSNELGLGVVPMEPEGRRFRDLAGQVNQLIAAHADEVYFVLSGVATRIK